MDPSREENDDGEVFFICVYRNDGNRNAMRSCVVPDSSLYEKIYSVELSFLGIHSNYTYLSDRFLSHLFPRENSDLAFYA